MEDISGSESEIRNLRTLMCYYRYLKETNEDITYCFYFTTISKEDYDSFTMNSD